MYQFRFIRITVCLMKQVMAQQQGYKSGVFLGLILGSWSQACLGRPLENQPVLVCVFRAGVLVDPNVDPLWSQVGGKGRQLCNYTVSVTYEWGFACDPIVFWLVLKMNTY